MKLVINKCYGGFGLSPKAVARLAELRGQKAYFFTGGIANKPRGQVQLEDISDRSMFWTAYNTPTPTPGPSSEEWHAMSMDERKASNAKATSESIDRRPDDRADHLLVRVVEELGEQANGSFAELKIIEIPDGIEYEIDEYDGMESVHEKHHSWS